MVVLGTPVGPNGGFILGFKLITVRRVELVADPAVVVIPKVYEPS